MLDSHGQLNISDSEWTVFLEDLQETFDKFEVSNAERDELISIIDSTKGDIVIGKS